MKKLFGLTLILSILLVELAFFFPTKPTLSAPQNTNSSVTRRNANSNVKTKPGSASAEDKAEDKEVVEAAKLVAFNFISEAKRKCENSNKDGSEMFIHNGANYWTWKGVEEWVEINRLQEWWIFGGEEVSYMPLMKKDRQEKIERPYRLADKSLYHKYRIDPLDKEYKGEWIGGLILYPMNYRKYSGGNWTAWQGGGGGTERGPVLFYRISIIDGSWKINARSGHCAEIPKG